METTYKNADQATIDRAMPILKGLIFQLPRLQKFGRLAIDYTLLPEAEIVILAGVAYCDTLAAEIGEDTFLGACGTPAEWRRDFERQLDRVAA